jgi:hypothetical protein
MAISEPIEQQINIKKDRPPSELYNYPAKNAKREVYVRRPAAC